MYRTILYAIVLHEVVVLYGVTNDEHDAHVIDIHTIITSHGMS